MITFKTHFITESMLEDIEFQEDLEQDILMLHEIEYKLSKLKDNPYSVNTKLFQNLFRRFYDTAYEIMESIAPQLENGFEQWKTLHQISDPETWANMVFENLEEIYGDIDQTIQGIMENGIGWGQLTLTPEKIREYVDPEQAEEVVKEDLYNSPEAYEYQIGEWLRSVKGFEGDDDEALEYYKENDLYDEFIDYFMENQFDPSDYTDIISPTPESIKAAIAQEMYPDYMDMYGDQIESIIEDIDEAIKRLKSAQRINKNLGDTIYSAADEKLGEVGEMIYKAVAKMTTAISLALNVNHVNGNILEDYAEISMDFMNELDTYDTTQWEKEVNGIMKRY